MIAPLTRRAVLLGLAASAVAPALADAPPGSARYIVEIVVFRQPGPLPKPVPVAPLASVAPIAGRVELLQPHQWQLGAAEQALARRGSHPLLAHAAWAAIVPANGRTTARLEDVLLEGTPLAGSIALQRSQVLFLSVDIDYLAGPGQVFGLRERRRVRFGERHYFDHPAFGIIAQVTPSRGAPAAD